MMKHEHQNRTQSERPNQGRMAPFMMAALMLPLAMTSIAVPVTAECVEQQGSSMALEIQNPMWAFFNTEEKLQQSQFAALSALQGEDFVRAMDDLLAEDTRLGPMEVQQIRDAYSGFKDGRYDLDPDVKVHGGRESLRPLVYALVEKEVWLRLRDARQDPDPDHVAGLVGVTIDAMGVEQVADSVLERLEELPRLREVIDQVRDELGIEPKPYEEPPQVYVAPGGTEENDLESTIGPSAQTTGSGGDQTPVQEVARQEVQSSIYQIIIRHELPVSDGVTPTLRSLVEIEERSKHMDQWGFYLTAKVFGECGKKLSEQYGEPLIFKDHYSKSDSQFAFLDLALTDLDELTKEAVDVQVGLESCWYKWGWYSGEKKSGGCGFVAGTMEIVTEAY